MRLSPLSLAFALSFATLSSAGNGQSSAPINPLSVEMTAQGKVAEQAANYDVAIDVYESALVADPRNAEAIMGLASVARKQGLPGKAISLYREALLLDPDDTEALGGIGLAYVDKGAMAKANETLARLEKICGSECGVSSLRAAIENGTQTAQASQTIENKPVATADPSGGS